MLLCMADKSGKLVNEIRDYTAEQFANYREELKDLADLKRVSKQVQPGWNMEIVASYCCV